MSINRVLTGLLFFILISCNQRDTSNDKQQSDSLEKEKYQIMALLIEQIPPGPPPPPGVYTKDTIAFNKYRDSVFKLDVDIAVTEDFVRYNSDREFNDLEKEYQVLIEKLKSISDSTNHKIEIEKIPVKKNRKLRTLTPTDNTRELLLGDSLDYVISFTEIILNPDKNKAIVISWAYSHPISGSSKLYLLKKENGYWKIFKRKTLSIS
ncbi:hypothetical protein [Aquimarina sediminis]|uniref:hypothetical protein n=1 Tax=Aquimarina sediminis TaxID=2070536 RepID=UPI000CA064A4|nr:hypothetical protein [Aquimarina sediminis]